MITVFQIDKSGNDIFEKDYSISLLKNNEEVYGINIPQKIKDKIIYLFNNNSLNITGKLRLKIRFHTAIIILLLNKAIRDEGFIEEINIQVCNDIDGHFNEIKDMIYDNLSKLISTIKRENIVQTKFSRYSLVNTATRNIREKNNKSKDYLLLKINEEELVKIVQK
jgi:hypothetical protein